MMRQILLVFLVTCCLIFAMFSCATEKRAKKSTEAGHKKGTGKLITIEGYEFTYKFYPIDQKGASVIFITGIRGRIGHVSSLAKELNKAGDNFIGFDYYDAGRCSSASDCIRLRAKRAKSGWNMFPTTDGKESSAEDIAQNEVAAVIQFLKRAPTYDEEKGIYLIGSSWGSWISLITIRDIPESLKGVVLLTPSVIPEMWAEGEFSGNYEPETYLNSLIKNYGTRPALAIGCTNDVIFRRWKGTTWDSAQFFQKEIGPNVELMKVDTSLHSKELLNRYPKVRESIIEWLNAQVVK